jgi:hypothetical protein
VVRFGSRPGKPERRPLGFGKGATIGFTWFRFGPDCVLCAAGDGLTVADPAGILALGSGRPRADFRAMSEGMRRQRPPGQA